MTALCKSATQMVLAMMALLFIAVFAAQGEAHAQSSALKNHDVYQPIDVSADNFTGDNKRGRSRLDGNVQITQGGMTLNAAEMLIFHASVSGQSDPQINRLDAAGNVRLASATETITADTGIYDVNARLMTFLGNVVLTRDSAEVRGERLEINLLTGLIRLDGRAEEEGQVKGRFGVSGGDQ